MIEVEEITVAYGQMRAVRGVSLSLQAGDTLAVVGSNGAGKTTLLRAIAGQLRLESGRILYKGEDITRLRAYQRARRGIAMVPEGRLLFPSLTVEENLLVGASSKRKGVWTLDSVYELFPLVGERRRRRAGDMSGGERQATAIARALMANPELLLLDEVSLGLAPAIVSQMYAALPRIQAEGTAVLIVEQDVRQALAVSDAVHCLLQGQTSLEGRDLELADISRAYFGY